MRTMRRDAFILSGELDMFYWHVKIQLCVSSIYSVHMLYLFLKPLKQTLVQKRCGQLGVCFHTGSVKGINKHLLCLNFHNMGSACRFAVYLHPCTHLVPSKFGNLFPPTKFPFSPVIIPNKNVENKRSHSENTCPCGCFHRPFLIVCPFCHMSGWYVTLFL